MTKNTKIIYLILFIFFILNYKNIIYEYNNFLWKKYFLSWNYDLSQKYFSKNWDIYSVYNQANSYYKNWDFDLALEKYLWLLNENNDIELSFKTFHNIWNTYFRIWEKNNLEKEKLLLSIINYEKALEIKEDFETRFNLEFVLEKLQDLIEETSSQDSNFEDTEHEQENLSQDSSEENSPQDSHQGEDEKQEDLEWSDFPQTPSQENKEESNSLNLSEEDREFLEQYQERLIQEQIRNSSNFNKNYNERNDIFDNFLRDSFFDNSSLNQENKRNW